MKVYVLLRRPAPPNTLTPPGHLIVVDIFADLNDAKVVVPNSSRWQPLPSDDLHAPGYYTLRALGATANQFLDYVIQEKELRLRGRLAEPVNAAHKDMLDKIIAGDGIALDALIAFCGG